MNEARTKAIDEKFCETCGEIIKSAAEICPKCGVRQKGQPNTYSKEPSGIGWYFEALKKYVVFSGRARRKEYWMFVLFFLLIIIPAAIIDVALGSTTDDGTGVFVTLYILGMILPSISVSVRRLHDLGKSGWFYWINFIPVIGPIWFLVLMCTEGNKGNNEYGDDPKQ